MSWPDAVMAIAGMVLIGWVMRLCYKAGEENDDD